MTGSFEAFGLAIATFFITHSLPAVRPLRRLAVEVVGERAYLVLYSILSLAALVWVVAAAVDAPPVPIWSYQSWSTWVPTILMAPACVLLVCGVSTPNPLSIGRPSGFDPKTPGIVAVTRHPVLWGFVLWSVSHLFPNGDLAVATMFALFSVFGVAGMPLIDFKRRREMGTQEWRALAGRFSTMPFAAISAGRTRLRWRDIGCWRLLAGAALYAALIALHAWIIGPWPLPQV